MLVKTTAEKDPCRMKSNEKHQQMSVYFVLSSWGSHFDATYVITTYDALWHVGEVSEKRKLSHEEI